MENAFDSSVDVSSGKVFACTLALDEIRIPEDARLHAQTDIDAMADSIRAIGVQTPLSVRPDKTLISGMLRYLGARLVGLISIDCFIVEDISVQTLWGLSENLHRTPLTALARSTAIAQWAAAKAVQVDQLSSGGRGKKGGVAEAARLLGIDRNILRRSAAIAAIPPETHAAIRKAGLDDNQALLLSIAASPPDQHLKKLHEYSTRVDLRSKDEEPPFQALLRAWNSCDNATKTRFIETIAHTYASSTKNNDHAQ